MGKTKVFGTANDDNIPAVEMKLAKIVQNAKAKNLGWTRLVLWKDKYGKSCNTPKNASRCCALGAAFLARDTKNYNISAGANDFGIDGIFDEYSNELSEPTLLGLGFRLAMSD